MALFLLYIIKSSICLTLFYLFFMLVMRGSTFFRFNRITLLAGTVMCMLLPFFSITVSEEQLVQIPIQTLSEVLTGEAEQPSLPAVDALWQEQEIFTENASPDASHTPAIVIGIVYIIGIIVTLSLISFSFFRMWQLIRTASRKRKNGYWLIIIPQPIHSFSWGKYIVLSEEDYRRNPMILTHEQMHLHCRHTLDLLWLTLVILLHWFNPVVWLIRLELQQLHEFEADEGVIKQGIDATQYQLLLVKKAVGTRLYSMANGFNHSKLKNRITMMLKERTNGWERLKLLIVMPVAMGAMFVFARPEVKETLDEIVPSAQQEGLSDLNGIKAFFKEKEAAYENIIKQQNDGSIVLKDKQLHFFRVNKRNQILIGYDTNVESTNEIRPKLASHLRKAQKERAKELGQSEAQGVIFLSDERANQDSVFSYLKEIKLAFEDLRKEYPQDENLDKVCPIWLHFMPPREYGKQRITQAEVTLLNEDGSTFKKFRKFTLNELADVIELLPKDKSMTVNLKVNKKCRMQEITDIKQVLRDGYLKLNYISSDGHTASPE